MPHVLLIIFLIFLPKNSFALAWNRASKSYYISSQFFLPVSYSSTSGNANIDAFSFGHKIYSEYGIADDLMFTMAFFNSSERYNLSYSSVLPYKIQASKAYSYQQYSGQLGLSYKLAEGYNKAISAQLFYNSGILAMGNGVRTYTKGAEEIGIGITSGFSSYIFPQVKLYLETSYKPSLYFRSKTYSPEWSITLGGEVKDKLILETGLSSKINAANYKKSPYYKQTIAELPHPFEYFAPDVAKLLLTKDHYDNNIAKLKVGFRINRKHSIDWGMYKRLGHEYGKSPTIFVVGYSIIN